MPIYWSQNHTRRQFLRLAALGGAGLVMRSRGAAEGSKAEVREAKLALLSDTHIPADPAGAYRGFRPVENLQRALPEVRSWSPEAAVICGDAARLEGRVEDYRRLKTMLAPLAEETAMAIAMGNHDDRLSFREVFTEPSPHRRQVADRQVLVLEWPVVRCVVLDSLLFVNKTPGHLGKAQREWLRRFLWEADRRPVVLFVHHPPDDGDGNLLDSERLWALIRPHEQVKAVFYGHTHVRHHGEWDRVQLINLPAMGYNFRDDQPVGWEAARFGSDGVDLTLHTVGGNQTDSGRTVSIAWRR